MTAFEWTASGRSGGSSLKVLALGAAVLLGSACSELAEAGETYTCVTSGTCDDPPPEDNPRWTCLGAPGTPPVPPAATGNVDYTLPIVDYVSQAAAATSDLRLQRCSKQDQGCLRGTSLPITTASNNAVTISLERSFGRDNYLLVTSTSVIGTIPQDINGDGMMPDPDIYIPYAYYFGDTVYERRNVAPDFELLRVSDVAGLALGAGIALNPTRSVLIVRAYDCQDNPAPGVQFAITYVGDDMDQPPQPYTIYGGLPIKPPAGDEFLPTDGEGQGGFANVPTGNVQITASVTLEDGRTLTIGSVEGVTATALPGQITAVEVHALPFGRTPPN